jgi:hypothetical protein
MANNSNIALGLYFYTDLCNGRLKALQAMKKISSNSSFHKAPGKDKILNHVLKVAATILMPILAKVFNASYSLAMCLKPSRSPLQ